MADIGDKLRSAREAKGLSIADIEKATKIQSRYLNAIEQNDFDKLPGDFYVRAFIRQYAQIVGLDGKELLSEYHQDVPASKPDEYVENSIDNKSEEVRETTDSKKNLWKNYLPRIAVFLGVIIVILIIYVLYAHLSSGGQNNNAGSNVTVSSQKSSSKKKAKPVIKKAAVKISQIGNNEYRVTGLTTNRHLIVKAGNQAISASVAVNGTITWQQNMAANAKHTINLAKNAKTVVINLGNDNGTSVKIGGKRVPYVPTGSNLSLRLLIGKKAKTVRRRNTNHSSSTTNTNNNNSTTSSSTNNNSGSTSSSTTNNNANRRNTQRQSSQRQTQNNNTQSSTTQNNNRQNNNTQSSSHQSQQSSSSANTSTGSTGD